MSEALQGISGWYFVPIAFVIGFVCGETFIGSVHWYQSRVIIELLERLTRESGGRHE